MPVDPFSGLTDNNDILNEVRSLRRAIGKQFNLSKPQTKNDDSPSPSGQRQRLYSDVRLTSSGNTVTASASESAKVSIRSVEEWIPIDFTVDITNDATGSTADKKYDYFLDYDQAAETWVLQKIAWTNETTRATSLDTVDGVRLASSDNAWRYIGTARYNGTSMVVSSTDNLGTYWCGTGDPFNPTGSDPFTGTIMNADGFYGYNAGVLQSFMKASDGSFGFGAGAGSLSVTGMNMLVGDAIFFGGYGIIGTSEVGATPTPVLNLEVYDQSVANSLTNGGFETGDLTGWTTAGSPTVISTDFYAGAYCASLPNAATISQTVGTFSGKHPVCYFYHKGPQVTLLLEFLDAGSVALGNKAIVLPVATGWIRGSLGMYNDFATATQVKITFTSAGAACLIDGVVLQKQNDYARLTIGDAYSTNKDVVRVAARKLLVGNGSASDRTEMLDIRGSGYIAGAFTLASTLAVTDVATFSANPVISNTAPTLTFTDTTASAKSLTIKVDANKADLRESAGAAGSLLQLDLSTLAGLFGGALSVTGDFAVNTSKFTVTASSGNTLVAGTLAVTGVATFTGNPIITSAAPSLAFTDTTGSAKSLTIAVDANKADFRESAGAAASLLQLDLANNRVGVGMAATNTLDVTGTFGVTTSSSVGEIGSNIGGSQAIADDGVYSFTPTRQNGIIIFTGVEDGAATVGGVFFYRVQTTAALVALSAGSNTNVTTGALTGTTGTDTKFTISAHTDGKIYLENRRGASRTTRWILFL